MPERPKPISISLQRVEGTNEEISRSWLFATPFTGPGMWIDASQMLLAWSDTAPLDKGYDKVYFSVLFENGWTYRGRYDLVHWSREMPDLERRFRNATAVGAMGLADA